MQSALKCYQKYSTGVEKYHYRFQIQNYIQQSLPVEIKTSCSTRKILRLLTSTLRPNLFQCSILCWLMLKSNSLFTTIKSIPEKSISQITILTQQLQKKLFLYLLLNGYYVRNSFIVSGQGRQIQVDCEVLQVVRNFRQIFQDWKPEKTIKMISLGEINKIFETWGRTNKQAQFGINRKKVDYNKVVDKILFLSKTYNVGGDQFPPPQQNNKDFNTQKQGSNFQEKQHVNKNRKKRKLNQQLQKQLFVELQSPLKNSVTNKIRWFQDDRNNQVNPLRRSTRTLNLSIFQLKQEKFDLNQSLFRSYKSRQSVRNNLLNSYQDNNLNSLNNNFNMLNSMRNTVPNNNNNNSNNNNAFLNLNGSFTNFQNNKPLGFGNTFRSSLDEEDDRQFNISSTNKLSSPSGKKPSANSGKKGVFPPLKLKSTASVDGQEE